MSSGGRIPYHLRQNKAIERNLFIDLLGRIGRHFNISEFTYVGFGGPFLEDFKHLHSALRISRMTSIEYDNNVLKRQNFNKPLSCINLTGGSSSEFLSNYNFDIDGHHIVWFDYATPDIGNQLSEVAQLVGKLGHGDIFKITVNANPQSLGHENEGLEKFKKRAETAKSKLGEYGPALISADNVKQKSYASLLLKSIIIAAKKGLNSDPALILEPLTSFAYADGQQMLTFTGILLNHGEREEFLHSTRLEHWPFYNKCEEGPKNISVPIMSTKERVHVEALLPEANADRILQELDYHIGPTRSESKSEMNNFISFYRMYPWYSRIVV